MTCDVHVHAFDPAAPETRETLEKMRRGIFFKIISRKFPTAINPVSSQGNTPIANPIVNFLEKSKLDKAVLLALDKPHDSDGSLIPRNNFISTSNDYVSSLASGNPKILFGASIHPYRKDASRELERDISRGACLVKWLPSSQNIEPDNPLCFPFYEILAHHKVPLLSHTGNEHFMPSGNSKYNDPARLLPALKMGVKVIAAHCGARIFLHERCHFKSWCRMALEHENFFGDTGAFIVPTRISFLRKFLKEPRLMSKVLYASDIPGIPLTWSCLFKLGFSRTRKLGREENPFNLSLMIFRELGFPDEFFSRALGILRISQDKKAVAHG